MKKIIFWIIILFFKCIILYSEDDYPILQLSKKLKQGLAGKYELLNHYPGFYAPKGVKALLYIPESITNLKNNKCPLIIFYHGMTNNPYSYKIHINDLIKYASEKKFILLSVQNIWGIDSNRDTERAILDSIEATIEFIKTLTHNKIINSDLIFTSGFSAGGFVALCCAIMRPDLIRGVGNFKGNYYQYVMDKFLLRSREMRDFLKIDKNKRNFKDLSVFIALGGINEASRIKEQIPLAIEFLTKSLFINVLFKKYSDESHILSKNNFYDFWKFIENIIINTSD